MAWIQDENGDLINLEHFRSVRLVPAKIGPKKLAEEAGFTLAGETISDGATTIAGSKKPLSREQAETVRAAIRESLSTGLGIVDVPHLIAAADEAAEGMAPPKRKPRKAPAKRSRKRGR